MGKPTGFLEYERKTIPNRDPLTRLKDWDEIHEHPEVEKVQTQGARCMDCGTPYCHTGHLEERLSYGCPINNIIPEFNDLVYRGRWKDAYQRLRKTNNFPEFTGRVCPAPCEHSCVLGVIEPPVTIKNIECSIIDKAWEEGWVIPEPPEERTGKKIAVVGSGPAGLSAADELNRAGHSVTVYERADRIGGLLMYGIPNMKLGKAEVVERRVKIMVEEGVKFVTNADVGNNISVVELREDFDAIVLACGATKPRDLPIDGRDLKGVHFAMEFLTKNTQTLLDKDYDHTQAPINAKDKNVVVIGGGDTGTDCVGTSLRQGAKSVTQLEIMGKPPEARAANNPWPEWANVYMMDYGQQEAAAKQGQDPRKYLVMSKRFVGDEDGKLTGLEICDIEWGQDESGRRIPVPKPDSTRIIPADLVTLAMGFLGPEQYIVEKLGLQTDRMSNVDAKYDEYKTSIDNIFSCGDMRRGQSLVVWAINEGRGCAREVDRFLMGSTQLPG